MKILLCNWTHRHNTPGGTENRYTYLKQIFPEAELISYADLFNNGEIKIKDHKEAARKMDEYYLKRYNDDKDILIIRDDAVGGVLDTHIPQITIFGNPYKSLSEIFEFGKRDWNEMAELQKNAEKTKKIAVSNFMKKDMEKIGLIPDEIIPNPVDIDFFKPLNKEKLRKKYKLPNKQIGIWIGASDNPVKNPMMISQLTNILDDVFWILVVKNRTECPNKNVKIFCNVDKNTMRDLYNCSDFFILTSPIEGCNHVIFEAMACDIPCIVSSAGYFWDFWDNRIGYRIEWNDILVHIGAIKMINKIKTNPRQVIIDRGLDLKTWEEKWKKLVNSQQVSGRLGVEKSPGVACNSAGIYIDVGGMYGQTVDKWLKEGVNKIITLEPNPKLYESLKRKYSTYENVVVLPIALWNETCTRNFYISKDDWGSSLHEDKKNLIEPEIIKAQCMKATEFIKEFDNDIFLHLNCEGAEFEIMEDLIESGAYKKIKKLEIAFHHQEYRLDCQERYGKLCDLMKEKGIKFEDVSDDA